MEPESPASRSVDPLLEQCFVLPLLRQLQAWRAEAAAGRRRLPLIALNGPVGAGKTTLGRQLEALAPGFGLRLVVASIDDVYLGWPERGERLAGNPFGVSRVPPGSHDLPLLLAALKRWRQTGILRLPRFDKTLAAGQGDRAGWREQDCDALVLEGWLMGCQPLSESLLTDLIQSIPGTLGSANESDELQHQPDWEGSGAPALRPEEWNWLPRWNRELERYRPLWQACDGLWLLRPVHWGLPRRWRVQAEARQRRAGGGWLPACELDQLVRASLCSLPPALYQEPLSRTLAGGAVICAEPSATLGLLGITAGSGVEASDPRRCHEVQRPAAQATVRSPAEGSSRAGAEAEPGAALPSGMSALDTRPSQLPWPEPILGPKPSASSSALVQPQDSTMPPIQAVAWLDGRRRCRSVWLQPSLSPSSSATG